LALADLINCRIDRGHRQQMLPPSSIKLPIGGHNIDKPHIFEPDWQQSFACSLAKAKQTLQSKYRQALPK